MCMPITSQVIHVLYTLLYHIETQKSSYRIKRIRISQASAESRTRDPLLENLAPYCFIHLTNRATVTFIDRRGNRAGLLI